MYKRIIKYFIIHVMNLIFVDCVCIILVALWLFKGCGMYPWLVLVSPCFGENVVATCKIGSFLCSLDNLLQKNGNCSLFWKSNFKMALIWKKGYFDLLFTFSSHQGKGTKIPTAHVSLTYIHVFCSPYWLFLPYQFWKKNTNLSGTVSLWYEFWCWFLIILILEQSLMKKIHGHL